MEIIEKKDSKSLTPMGDLIDLVNNIEEASQQDTLKKNKSSKHKLLQPPDPNQGLTDKEILENPPAWTGYNSLEGYKIVNGQKVYDGQYDCFGNKIHAPILTDEQWAAKYITFTKKEKYRNADGRLRRRNKTIPAKLNKVDFEMLERFNMSDRVVILATRGYHKSTTLQIKVFRSILDEQLNVIYYSATITKSKEFTQRIRTLLKYTPSILRDYGYVIDEKQGDRADQFCFVWQVNNFNRDPGCAAGSVEGGSKTGGHPDIIACDDVCDTDSKSETKQRNMWDWYSTEVEGMIMGSCVVLFVGTPKDKHDLYAQLDKTDMYDFVRLKGIVTWPNHNQRDPAEETDFDKWSYVIFQGPYDKKPLAHGVRNIQGGQVYFDGYMEDNWNDDGRVQYYIDDDETKGLDRNRMAMQEFLLKLKVMGMAKFEAEIQMNPIVIQGGQFDFSRMKFIDINLHPNKHMILNNVAAMFDQSFGYKDTADYNCITVVGYYNEDFYFLDMDIWQNQFDAIEEKAIHVMKMYKKWPTITIFGIEADAANSQDWNTIQFRFQDMPIPIQPVFQGDYFSSTDDEERQNRTTNIDLDPSLNIKKTKVTKVKRIYFQWYSRLMEYHVFWNQNIAPEVLEWFQEEWNFPENQQHFDGLDSGGSAMDLSEMAGDQLLFCEGGFVDSFYDNGFF